MKFSLHWLSDYCNWNWSSEELLQRLTMSGTEVEGVKFTGVNIPHVITAKVLSFVQHPNADRLRLCEVFDGQEKRSIVCGAQNFSQGDVVLLALPGAQLPGGLVIKKAKIRGETSEGMLCSASELGLAETSEGIMILPPKTSLGDSVSTIFPADTLVEVEITSNRSDLLSYQGMARELAALGACLKQRETPSSAIPSALSNWTLRIEDAAGCPRYTACLLTSVHVQPSPEWMQKRLQAAGLRPINNVVDITNFLLLELGQPLHAFNAHHIHDQTLVVRRAHPQEGLQTLDNRALALDPRDLVIADSRKPLAFAGVMGGLESAIDASTTTVLLESASFQPTSVRATSRRHGLLTDAAFRFERFIDPALVDVARERAVAFLVEYAGACPVGLIQNAPYTQHLNTVAFRPERFESVIGATIPLERMTEILQKLGCTPSHLGWKIPSWRPDLTREIDLIEEIIRVEGLHIVKGKVALGVAPQSNVDLTHDRDMALRRQLASWGFYEAITSSFVPRGENEATPIELINPMNAENARMRSEVLSTLLPSLAHNLGRGESNVLLFEMGRTFHRSCSSILRESEHLCLVATGNYTPAHWAEPARPFDFFALKGVLEQIQRLFPEIKLPAHYGFLPSERLAAYGIKVPVLAAEIELPPISPLQSASKKKFKPLAQYPPITRDLAFVADLKISQQEIADAIGCAHVEALESFECFDFFKDPTGQKLDPSKKSLAYTFTYRATDRTLQEGEVKAWEKKILDCVLEKTGASLRV